MGLALLEHGFYALQTWQTAIPFTSKWCSIPARFWSRPFLPFTRFSLNSIKLCSYRNTEPVVWLQEKNNHILLKGFTQNYDWLELKFFVKKLEPEQKEEKKWAWISRSLWKSKLLSVMLLLKKTSFSLEPHHFLACGLVFMYLSSRLFPRKTNFQGAHKAKTQEVRSPTCEVLVSTAKNLGIQCILLSAPGYRAPVIDNNLVPSSKLNYFISHQYAQSWLATQAG